MSSPATGAGSAACPTHLVLIPSYNTGARLLPTVREALREWPEVMVVIDGSTDGSGETLEPLREAGLRLLRRARNGGKGAAVFDGLQAAAQEFTHVLVMDADGQHPAQLIGEFMRISRQHPNALVLGAPHFDASAPRLRVVCRRLANFLTRIETATGIGDSMFGFRVYPLADLLAVMRATPHMRGFDFDTEALVRLSWRGLPLIHRAAPVRYFRNHQGGVSHYRYGRDNWQLARTHCRLLVERFIKPSRR